ncbi:MAG TPA: hypothetical protein VF163_16125, partial [Micromonosporaceae bacterium]
EAQLLTTYHDERYAAARENLAVTEATIRFMVPPNLPRRLLRAVLLRLSHPFQSARDRVNSGRMAEPYVYAESPLVEPGQSSPLAGHFAPDGWVRTPRGRQRLRTLFGTDFTLLLWTDDRDSPGDWNGVAPAVVPLRVVAVLPPGARPNAGAVSAEDVTLRDAYGMRGGGWTLVRPDGHVAASAIGPADPARTATLLRRCARSRTTADVLD